MVIEVADKYNNGIFWTYKTSSADKKDMEQAAYMEGEKKVTQRANNRVHGF